MSKTDFLACALITYAAVVVVLSCVCNIFDSGRRVDCSCSLQMSKSHVFCVLCHTVAVVVHVAAALGVAVPIAGTVTAVVAATERHTLSG